MRRNYCLGCFNTISPTTNKKLLRQYLTLNILVMKSLQPSHFSRMFQTRKANQTSEHLKTPSPSNQKPKLLDVLSLQWYRLLDPQLILGIILFYLHFYAWLPLRYFRDHSTSQYHNINTLQINIKILNIA